MSGINIMCNNCGCREFTFSSDNIVLNCETCGCRRSHSHSAETLEFHCDTCGCRRRADSITKEASVGMIIGQGDPSSPPSGIFMAEDPTRAEASDLGGPTEPSNAGVPADVGGDDLVPYDSPSAPPASVFMNAESNVYETKPFKNAMLGIAFTISALTFWSTAGTAVKTYVVSVVDTYAPKLLEPQNKIIITTLALVGIVYFGNRLRSENKPLTIPRMIDLTDASATDV